MYVEIKDIELDRVIFAKARYLFWACFRGHIKLVKFILE